MQIRAVSRLFLLYKFVVQIALQIGERTTFGYKFPLPNWPDTLFIEQCSLNGRTLKINLALSRG